MKGWLGLVLAAALLALAWFAFNATGGLPLAPGADPARLVYLLMWLLLVTGAGFGFARIRADRGRAVVGIVFWGALIVGIVLIYEAVN